jgi:uncharacterized membrane protein
MAHCTKCGAAVADNAGFCPACGAPQTLPGSIPSSGGPIVATQTGIAENVAGLLCYLLGWVTGLIFFLIDKRPYVQFHARQSIVIFGSLQIIQMIGVFAGFAIWGLHFLLVPFVGLVATILWIVLMIKAYQGVRFRVPVAADIADSLFGKSS